MSISRSSNSEEDLKLSHHLPSERIHHIIHVRKLEDVAAHAV